MTYGKSFDSDFVAEALKGTPVVAAAAWTLNDILIVVSIAFVIYQTAFLTMKWRKEFGQWPWQSFLRRGK